MKKKIVFVANYFYPDYASTGQLLTELCLDLQNDFDITVIAAQPGYAGEKIKTKKIFERDELEQIQIVRLNLPSVDKKSKFSRLKYIFTYFILANIAVVKEKSIDAIYTISQPPVLGGLIGSIGKFIKRSKHIYNIQDFNPEQAAAVSYTNKQFIFNWAKKVDMLNCRYSDKIILVGHDMAETLKERFKGNDIPAHTIINNWTNEKELLPLSKDQVQVNNFLINHNLQNKFIVMYSGNIGLYYDLENIIKITSYFKDYNDMAFVFIGEGAVKDQMKQFVDDENIDNVHFLPYQDKEFIKYSLNAADAHLVVNQKGIKGVSVPSKIYGVMAVGKPVLGVLEDGSEAQMLIEKSNCGLVVEPKDYEGLISNIQNLYEMSSNDRIELGLNGREYLDQHLRRESSINRYRQTLKDVLEK